MANVIENQSNTKQKSLMSEKLNDFKILLILKIEINCIKKNSKTKG